MDIHPDPISNENASVDLSVKEIELCMKIHTKQSIHEILKEYHRHNANVMLSGGKTKTIDEVALNYIKEKL